MPWHGGSRVVLVAFTVKNHERITAQDVNDLQGLGFQLPARTTSAGDCVRVGVSKRLPQSSGCHSPSLAGPPVVLTPNAKVLAPLGSDPTAGPGSAPLGHKATSVTVPDDGTSGVMRMQAGLGKPSFVELFCGSAGLSAEMRQLGFQVLGVDNKPTAKQARAPVINLDLRDPEQQDRLWPELRRANVVWIAPPCGTSSAARRIPLHGRHKGPRPLRSRAHPDGVPGLTSTDAARVASANALYGFASKVFSFCLKHGTLCIVENPASSLTWQTSWFRELLRQSQVCWHEFHACMYGSARQKRTGLLSTARLPGLMRRCDASHSHKAWGRTRTGDKWTFATAAEAAYPPALCQAAARDISLALRDQGICLNATHSTDTAASATNAQKQPRRGRGTVGPPEYKQYVLVRLPVACIPPDFAPKDPPAFLAGMPPGSKLLWTRVLLDGGIEVREAEYGVYHTPQEFLQEATKVTHPFDSAVTIDGPNLRAIAFTLEHGVRAVSQKRRALLEHYRAIERSLRDQEFALKESMDPAVRRVMGSKKLLLFKQMLADAGVPDENLFNDMVNGFRLTGSLEPSGLFPPKYKPAVISVDELRRSSQWAKHLIEGACRKASRDPAVAKAVWDESLQQVNKGWLAGPFTWEQMDERFGGTWIASKRFGVCQGDKVRAVDDLSQFQVNASVTETEKIQLEGLDDIVALARFFLGATVQGTKSFRLPMANGGTYHGRLHRDFRNGLARHLRGRALDLRSAYKQLARHPEDGWASVLGVLDAENDRVVYFESFALPFGASSAVTGFNRAARALRIILSRLFFLVNTSFFDDYCQLELEGLTESADETALGVLGLLGWEVSDGDKLKPFAPQFSMLGAVVSFEDAAKGLIRVRNKPGRLEEISSLCQRFAEDPLASASLLPSLKGKLLFASSHVFGRCAQIATQLIHHAERESSGATPNLVVEAVHDALRTLQLAGDRRVNLWSEQPPVLLFTDGACEDNGSTVTHGAVIIDCASQTKEFFGGHIPADMVRQWRDTGRSQLIFFAELYPVLIARHTWYKVLRNRRVLIFVDNEAAKAALIRNYSPLLGAAHMLAEIASLDVKLECFPWYCRVPSKSNLADAASRLAYGEYEECFRQVQPMLGVS